jgi:hypothetical protein
MRLSDSPLPNFAELVQALDFVIKNDYPARGEFVGPLQQ